MTSLRLALETLSQQCDVTFILLPQTKKNLPFLRASLWAGEHEHFPGQV